MRSVSVFMAEAFLLVLLTFAPLDAGTQTPPMTIQVQGDGVTVQGLTPGGDVVVIAGWSTKARSVWNIDQPWRAAVADSAGTATVTFYRVPDGAVVAAADVATGRVAVSDVGSVRFSRIALAAPRFRRNADREVERIESPHERALIVVVRPGIGAWAALAGDGARGDQDGQSDGIIRTDPAALIPIAQSPPPPPRIKHKDVVVLVDAHGLVLGHTEVPE